MGKRNILILAVMLIVTLLSAGCTTGNTQGVTETTVQAESVIEENTDENVEAKVLQSEEKSILVLVYPEDLGDMNPYTMSSSIYAQDWVYDRLTALINGKIVPELAENWEILEDGKTHAFHLRRSVKFSNGLDLNAGLVKENIQDIVDNKDGYSFLQCLKEIDTMDTSDDTTLTMSLKDPCNSLLSGTGFNRLLTVAGRAAFPESGNIYRGDVRKPVGTGMWTIKEYVQDQYIIFERDEYYWSKKPPFKYVKVEVTPDMNMVVNASKVGEIGIYTDVSDGLSVDTYYRPGKLGFGTQMAKDTQMTSLSLNTAGDMPEDVSVHQASEYVTDNTMISEYVYGSLQKPASSYFANSVILTQTDTDGYPYQLEKAAEILELAGWNLESGSDYQIKNGVTLEVDTLYDTVSKNGKNIGLVFQGQYKRVGVELNVCKEGSRVFGKKWKEGGFDMILYSSWGGSYEPLATLVAMRNDGDKSSTVQKGMDNKAKFNKVINEVPSEIDGDKLKEDFTYIMESFKEQAIYIPLAVSSTLAVYDSSLRGLNPTDGRNMMPAGGVVREQIWPFKVKEIWGNIYKSD